MSTTIKVILIFSVIFVINSCQKRRIANESHLVSINEAKAEDFVVFVKKFYSDSIFQVNRIIFPLENDKKMDKEYEEAKKDSNNIHITNENNYASYNKNNWVFLSDIYFKNNDSIATIEGVPYLRRFYKTNKFVEESILSVNDGFVMIRLKYKLINGKWYLVDYVDGFNN